MSFVLSLSGLVVVYLASYGHSLLALKVYLCLSAIGSIVLSLLLLSRRYSAIFSSADDSSGSIVYTFFACAFVAVALFLGTDPILFSDTWGHLTIIKRLLDHNSTVFTSGFFPGEIFLLTFAPWHAVLAAVASLIKVEPLDVWRVAQVFLPLILTLSYLSFVEVLYPPLRSRKLYLFIFGALFILLYPGAIQLLRGEADYKVVNSILLFQAYRLFWLIWNDQDRTSQPISIGLLALICITMCQIHVVEAGFFSMIALSYGGISWCFKADKKIRFVQLLALGSWLLLGQIAVLKIFFAGVSSPHSVVSYREFLGSLSNYWGIYLGPPSIIAALVLYPVLRRLRKEQVIWIATCALIGSILGSYNPILYPIYSSLMTSQLARRTLILFPSYLILGIFCFLVIEKKLFENRKLFRIIGLTVVNLSVAAYLYTLWGINGEASYFWSDKISAMRLYPKLYDFVKTKEDKVFLGDPFVSVPITAISSNFAISHRPWNNADIERQRAHLLVQTDLSAPELKEAIRRYKINFIFINKSSPPASLVAEQKKYPELYRFGQLSPVNIPPYLEFKGEFDGILVFEVLGLLSL